MTDFFEALSLWVGRGKPIVAPSRIHDSQVGTHIRAEFAPEEALAAFEDNVLVYRSTMGYMTHGATIPLAVQIDTKDGWEDVYTPTQGEGAWRLHKLLETPDEDLSYGEWAEVTIGHLMSCGEGFSRKIPGVRTHPGAGIDPSTGKPRFEIIGLEPFVPLLDPVPGANGRVKAWERKWMRKDPNPVPADEMIFFRMPSLSNIYRGLSPVRPFRRQVAVHGRMFEWGENAYRDRIASEYHFQRKGPVDSEVLKTEAEEILSLREGAPYRPLFTDDSWKIDKFASQSAREMDFGNSLVRVREEVLSGAGTPPVVAGYFDNATLANAQVSIRAFFRYYLIPAMIRVKNRTQMSLVPHFGSRDKIRLKLDTSNVRELVDDLEIDALTFIRLQQAGVPYNEAAILLNLKIDPIPGKGDQPHGIIPPPKTIGGAEERRRDEEKGQDRTGGLRVVKE